MSVWGVGCVGVCDVSVCVVCADIGHLQSCIILGTDFLITTVYGTLPSLPLFHPPPSPSSPPSHLSVFLASSGTA